LVVLAHPESLLREAFNRNGLCTSLTTRPLEIDRGKNHHQTCGKYSDDVNVLCLVLGSHDMNVVTDKEHQAQHLKIENF